jgi:16S rRNA G1207 methylase RsmC
MSNNRDFLQKLKVGDEVIVEGRYDRSVQKIEKVTENFLIIDGTKYRKQGGMMTGANSFHYSFLNEATPEVIDKINNENRLRNLRSFMRSLDINSLSIETMLQIREIITKQDQKA